MNRLRNRLGTACALTVSLTTTLGAQTVSGDHRRPPLFVVGPIASTDQFVPDFTAAPNADDQVVQKPAGPPPTPRHTGVKAMVKDLVDDVKHLPSMENLFWAG